MSNEIMPVRLNLNDLNHSWDDIFSAYTHPRLEGFIQKVIDTNRNYLPTELSGKLVREFLLYGFLRASEQEFLWWDGKKEIFYPKKECGQFDTNNGVLAVSDFNRKVYIRGGDSYHGYFPDLDEEPLGVEGTLINSGYKPGDVFVPHSNGDVFADEKREKLFTVLHYFSREVRNLRGESTSGLIVKDFSKPEPSTPYKKRDSGLPKIVLKDLILIPGNKLNTIQVD